MDDFKLSNNEVMIQDNIAIEWYNDTNGILRSRLIFIEGNEKDGYKKIYKENDY